ncbi:MAG: universal stress protein [Fimbriiglobus sp.]|jgi:nucleotide-binding universal stress UspA family protein|nr:universal stress protein [Fimbriiglobus sp.]
MSLQSVLVPLDGSGFGEHALRYALAVAGRSGARLELAHAREPVGLFDVPGGSTPEEEDLKATERAMRYLAEVRDRVKAAGFTVTTTLLHGSLAESLQQFPGVPRPDHLYLTSALLDRAVGEAVCGYAAQTSPDLMVITTHGRGPLSRWWFGSVATDVVRRCPVPLLLVRPAEETVDLTHLPTIRRILLPLDGSPWGEQVIRPAVTLGQLFGVEYRLLRVVPPVLTSGGVWPSPLVPGRSVAEQLQAEADGYLVSLAHRIPALGRATLRSTADWPPAGAILADAEASGVDLIALTTHGRGGIERLLLGSVADKVVRGTTRPVLLCRPPSAEAN